MTVGYSIRSALCHYWAGLTELYGKFIPVCLACLVGLAGCGGSSSLAPVGHSGKSARSQTPINRHASTHIVHRGETLYSIAFQYGKDYRQLARLNGIRAPYTIYVGQRLLVRAVSKTRKKSANVAKKSTTSRKSPTSSGKSTQTRVARPVASTPSVKKPVAGANTLKWRWPTRGKVIETYSSKDETRKGIDISGRLGQSVTASAAGRVVYSGSGLRGYGKLIIVKHNERFLSAYAHNRKLLVKEGQHVKQGQKIAEMGRSGVDRVKLHFQIRRDGKPIDPLRYLPRRG
ncbi:MAG: peptidoglycan DD-metalloendopeptidase family protein [Granulosicoccaceae bacterium]|jgi:lipoprotein NlpD